MTYEELEDVINNIYASQGKVVQDKIIKVWCKEIAAKSFYDDAIHKAEEELMSEELERITLPKLLSVMYKHNNAIKNSMITREKCEYCKGLNYVYTNLYFSKGGKFLSLNYAIKCYHNNNKDNCAKMVFNEEIYNKTQTANGYMLVFKDEASRMSYLNKVLDNGGYDLGVNINEVIGEKDFS